MKRLILSLTIISICYQCFSQPSDFIVIRKKGINVRTFLKGSYARFITTTGEPVVSRVVDIKNDTLYFREVILQRVGTIGGGSRLDTVATPLRGIHYSEIGAIPRRHESFTYIKNGTLLMIGGAGYLLLNIVNGAYLHYPPFGKKNLPGMATATGVFALGYIMHKLHNPYLKVGRKYAVEYIRIKS